MNFALAFDTTAANLSLSLALNGKIIDKFINPRKLSPAETILNSVEFFLLKNNLKLEEISQFFVVNGPASFIRIRISITVAKALAFLFQNAKFYTINYFEIYHYLFNKDFPSIINKKMIILYGYGDIFYVEFSDHSQNETSFQKAMKASEIKDFIQNNKINCLICDEKSTNTFLNLDTTIKIIDLSKKIENLSEIAMMTFFNLSSKEQDLEPFYLITPIFRKVNSNT